MFTVIIPTMWRYRPFIRFLWDLFEVPTVGQVIIINNNIEQTPADLAHEKLLMLNQPSNIYVNPAWNLGVENAAYEKICIANDDLIFDLKMFHFMSKVLQSYDGVYGMCGHEPTFNQPPVIDGNIDIVRCTTEYDYQRYFGFGQLMFLNKRHWIPIPEGLNIYWGDNFIYDMMYYKLNRNFMIYNFLYHTPNSVTCTSLGEDLNEHYAKERLVYNAIMPGLVDEMYMTNKHRTGLVR